MGKNIPTGVERARAVVAGTFSADGSSDAVEMYRQFNVWVGGDLNVARIALERSFDGGVTWFDAPQQIDPSWDTSIYIGDRSFIVSEPEQGILYRLTCRGWSSGNIAYRLSQ